MTSPDAQSGWQLVAESDEAASLLGTLVALEPDEEYTRSDLATAADVPLKTLYLVDTLESLVEIGVLERADDGDDESETTYRLDGDSPVLHAAREFDEAVTDQLT